MTFEEIKKAISGKTVGIAGCGGLGSNCAIALARIGIGKLVIADFDKVSEANLNRQYFFLNQIGQKKAFALRENIFRVGRSTLVIAYDLKITSENAAEIFRHCDVVVEAFDLADMKKMLIETLMDEMPEKDIVSGIGLGGWGNNNEIRYIQSGKLHICGDMVSEVSDINPPLAPRVGIVANMQANTVLELLLKKS
jgi:sulfur carrier protein ThiS adenylyltransferase